MQFRKIIISILEEHYPNQEILSITTLKISHLELDDLDGIELFTNLVSLDISHNNLTDLTPLKDLKKLKQLNTGYNLITSLKPLRALNQLQYLYIQQNRITSIQYLLELPLKQLYIGENYIDVSDNFLSDLKRIRCNYIGEDDQLPLDQRPKDQERPVNIDHPHIIKAIQKQLNISITSFTTKHILKIQKLDLSNIGLTHINDIEQLPRLESLDLSGNMLQSIDVLASLRHLKYLDLSNNPVEDLRVLKLHKQLRSLNLSGTAVSDFSPLQHCPELKKLSINQLALSSLSLLPSNLTITSLEAQKNNLTDLNGINQMPLLTRLTLEQNQLVKLTGIEHLTELESVVLSLNQITDIRPLLPLKKLNKLYLSQNCIVDTKPFQTLNVKTKVSIDKNFISNISPLLPLEERGCEIYGIDDQDTLVRTPTPQQQSVIDHEFKHSNYLIVNAFAGSGKTTTALDFAFNKVKPGEKILYLTFNRTVSDDIKRKIKPEFQPQIDVKTAHGLAYAHLKLYKNFKIINSKSYTPVQIKNRFNLQGNQPEDGFLMGKLILDFINFYLSFDHGYTPKDLQKSFIEFIDQKDFLENYPPEKLAPLLNCADTLLHDDINRFNHHVVSHDVYLKIFQLTIEHYVMSLSKYSYIIFDEAQDASMVMVDIIKKLPGKKLFIGDTHQQIYRFRYAVNMMEGLDEGEHIELPHSFRFNKNIAAVANNVLKVKGSDTDIIGRNVNLDKLNYYRLDPLPTQHKIAVISRTSASLFLHAYSLLNKGILYGFQGGIYGYNYLTPMAKSIYYLFMSGEDRSYLRMITDPLIGQFTQLKKLEHYAFYTRDLQVMSMIKLIKEFGSEYLAVAEIITRSAVEAEYAKVVLTNTHKSKGLEFDRVWIEDDFKVNLDKKEQKSNSLIDEVNMLYVAVTRSREVLYLPENYKKLFTRNASLIPEEGFSPSNPEYDRKLIQLQGMIQDNPPTLFEEILCDTFNLPRSQKSDIIDPMVEMQITMATQMVQNGIPLEKVKKVCTLLSDEHFQQILKA